MRPRPVVLVAFLVYVLAIASLFALVASELLHRVVHAIP